MVVHSNDTSNSNMLTMRIFLYYFVPLVLLFGTGACMDLNFDEPPVTGLPDVMANTSIEELKALHTVGEEDQRIDADIVIGGVVIADDRNGNLQERIILQDETGGIVLRLKSVGLYNTFPVGRQVFVRARGLYLGDDQGVIELNGSSGRPLEEPLIDDHVVAGAREQVLIPDTVSLEALDERHISTLVHLRNVQFAPADTGLFFSDIFERRSLDRLVVDCAGNEIRLRTSGYADFGNARTPGNRGGLTAVYGVTIKSQKLLIRDLADIDFDMERCGEDSGSGSNEPVLFAIRTLRDSFAAGMRNIPQDAKISGVVISDRTAGNMEPNQLVLQDERAGIVLRFADVQHGYGLGEALEIDVSGLRLAEFQGLLQITEVLPEVVTRLGSAALPAPRLITVEEITENLESWESMLVRVEQVELSLNTVWEGSVGATDPTGTISLFTLPTAAFASEPLPEAPVDLVALVSQSEGPQLRIRSLEDVTVLDTGGGDLTELDEPFTGQEPDSEIDLEGWTNLAVKGTRRWEAKEFSGNIYAQATAYNDDNAAMETWLITPPIRLEEASLLSFRSAQAFFQHDGLSVWISKDFNGSNFNVSTWTQLSGRLAGVNSGQNQWVDSGDIDLSEFSGTVYIGFRYVGNSMDNTTTYRIDDVRIRPQ